MLRKRSLSPELATLLAALALLLFYNLPFWQRLFAIVAPASPHGWLFLAAAWVLLAAFFNLILTLLAFPWVFKPVLSLLFISSALVAYFMNQYGVLIDAEMLRNALQTNPTEVRDLLTVKMLSYLLLLGLLPSWLLWRVPLEYRGAGQALLVKLLVMLGCLAVIGGTTLAFYQDFASTLRNHRELRFVLVPDNYLQALSKYLREDLKSGPVVVSPLAEDAHKSPAWSSHRRKSLTVLVVGETARAANFSLNGYARNTNPQLSVEPGVINFSNAHSCGTETAVSLPCMFSNLGRAHYSARQAEQQEGLLDVLQRAGLKVLWRDNQSGCKGTCDRVAYQDLSHATDPALCADHECRDEILLKDLQAYVDSLEGDAVLVLHQMGSHGPAYYKRYPAQFERFTPTCKTSQLDRCSQEEIVNAFDNSILYNDYVLTELIHFLRDNERVRDTAMLYLSDHGESLGEHNLYLHGTPYMLAPQEQTHIPMLLWLSEGYQQDFAVDAGCLRARQDQDYSQDNLFHSLLGLLEVDTGVYRKDLDIFAACRGAPLLAALRSAPPSAAR